jgi:hypothetical protein
MVLVLSGGVLSTVFIPDTEEVTGSIPVSPTSTKGPLSGRNAAQGPFVSASVVTRFWPNGVPA